MKRRLLQTKIPVNPKLHQDLLAQCSVWHRYDTRMVEREIVLISLLIEYAE